MKKIRFYLLAISLCWSFSGFTSASYDPVVYNVDNFDNDNSQWDEAGVTDAAWWDYGHSDTYQIGISSSIYYSSPYSLWVAYQKQSGQPGQFFQVDLTQDSANHTGWISSSSGEDGLMRIVVQSSQPNTELQFQIATGPESDYWSKWTDTYTLLEANVWYTIEIDWNNYNNHASSQDNDFNYIRRMNIVIDPSSDSSSGRIYLDNYSSLDTTIPEQPTQSEIISKLDNLKSYFGTTSIDTDQFLNTVLEKTFNYFIDSNAINLTYGLPRTGYNSNALSDKTWSNPTEWGYYLNALIVGKEFGLITATEFQDKVNTSLDTIYSLQQNDNESYQGQFYTYYFVKTIAGTDWFPYHDASQEWLPSIDNAFLAGSLIVLREYAREQDFVNIANLADAIVTAMNFGIYWNSYTKQFSHGVNMPGGNLMDSHWDIYANETPFLSLIAYALRGITELELSDNLDALNYDTDWYSDEEDFSITVEPCNWDGSLFTYLMPGIYTKVNEDLFGENSALPAVIAQLLWAKDNTLQYFGWSDIMASDTVEGGAPPSLHRTQKGWQEEIGYYSNIAPYALFLPFNLLSEKSTSSVLDPLFEICLHKAYSLYQTNVWSNNYDINLDMGYFIRASVEGEDNAHYFGTLDQFYILGSIFNYFRNNSTSSNKDFREYFYNDDAIAATWATMQDDLNARLNWQQPSDAIYVDINNDSGVEDGSQEYPFNTIQEGIDAAYAGKTILVAAGEYVENIYINKGGITVEGSSKENCTIVSPSVDSNVVKFSDFNDSTSTISDFTITGGQRGIYCSNVQAIISNNHIKNNQYSSLNIEAGAGVFATDSQIEINNNVIEENGARNEGYHQWGGGLYIKNSKAKIKGNIIKNNEAETRGGGGYLLYSDLEIINNIFERNKTHFSMDGIGGALFMLGCNNFSIVGNSFVDNDAWYYGGAIHVWYSGNNSVISNNYFEGNVSDEVGAISVDYNSSPVISNNIFVRNSAVQSGAIMCKYDTSTPTIINNTFVDNTGFQKGIGIFSGASPVIKNNIFANIEIGSSEYTIYNEEVDSSEFSHTNSSQYLGYAYRTKEILKATGPIVNHDISRSKNRISLSVSHNNIYPYSEEAYVGLQSEEGEIYEDPLFSNYSNDDFSLSDGSLCIDAGTNDILYLPETDFEGDFRKIDGVSDGQIIVDMGIDEYYGGDILNQAPEIESYSPDVAVVQINENESIEFSVLANDPDGGTVDYFWRLDDVEVSSSYNYVYSLNYSDGGKHSIKVIIQDLWGLSTSYTWNVEVTNISRIWHVDDAVSSSGDGTFWAEAFKTIQEGIEASDNGDMVLVTDGTYYENINFNGKNIVLQSENGADNTIIDGFNNEKVVIFNNGETDETVIDGFTIRNGYTYGAGGGIYCFNSSPIIKNCTISDNESWLNSGGGIYCLLSSPNIINCNIVNNYATGYGGGICSYYGFPVVSDSAITENDSRYYGGGVACVFPSSFNMINDCNISKNSALDGEGGGIYCKYSSPVVTNCVIEANDSENGGGIYGIRSASTIKNCVITRNISSPYGGGGISFENGSIPIIRNCTIVDNSAVSYGGGVYSSDESYLTIINCIIWGNSASEGLNMYTNSGSLSLNYSDIGGGWIGIGNIDENPLFVDSENGNFHLQANSPCIDVGTNDVVDLIETDFDGEDRIIDGDGDGEDIVDMGADEYTGESNNQAPMIESYQPTQTELQINEGESIDFSVTASDPDGDTLYYSWKVGIKEVSTASTYSYVTDYDDSGTYTITATVTDEHGLSAPDQIWEVGVINVNRPPEIESYGPDSPVDINEGESQIFSISALDLDGDTLSYSWEFDGQAISGEESSSYTYQPGYEDEGTYIIKVVVSDNEGFVNHIWNVNVLNTNRTPQIDSYSPTQTTIQIDEGDFQDFSIVAFDPDNDILYYSWTLNNTEVSTTSVYTYSPDYNSSGFYTLTVRVADGEGMKLDTYMAWDVEVIDINRTPVIDSYSPTDIELQVNEGESIDFSVTASDPDGDTLSYSWALDGLDVSTVSSYTYRPDYDASGLHTVVVEVSDPQGLTASLGWEVNVINVNRPPEIESYLPTETELEINEGGSIEFSIVASDPDVEDTVYYSWTLDGNVVSTASTYTYFSTSDEDIEHTVVVTVSDGEETAAYNPIWNIGVNRPPVIQTWIPSEEDIEINEGESIGFLIGASDPNNDQLSYQWLLDGNIVSTSVMYIYSSTYEDIGPHSIVVTVNDPGGLGGSRGWEVEVLRVNNAPEITLPGGFEYIQYAYVGEEFSFMVKVRDPDGDPITVEMDGPLNAQLKFIQKTNIQKVNANITKPNVTGSLPIEPVEIVSDNIKRGVFYWTPNSDQAGTLHEITFTASDGKLQDEVTVKIWVSE